MTRKRRKTRRPLFRVFANARGEVFLQLESGGEPAPVERPVTSETLNSARERLIERLVDEDQKELETKNLTTTSERKEAHKEIEAAIDPIRKGRWLSRAEYAVRYFMMRGATILTSLVLITFSYKAVTWSSEHLPDLLHYIVLGFLVLGLGYLVFVIGSEENRIKYRAGVRWWFGPHGMLVLPLALLGTAASVLASLTYRLHSHGKVALEACSGRPVSETGLMDFYVWHFVNIVPTLQITKLWRWGEPYCYSQSRVGLLIFAFQLLVVIPSFNTIRFYWKHRHTPSEYVFDPDWQPDPE